MHGNAFHMKCQSERERFCVARNGLLRLLLRLPGAKVSRGPVRACQREQGGARSPFLNHALPVLGLGFAGPSQVPKVNSLTSMGFSEEKAWGKHHCTLPLSLFVSLSLCLPLSFSLSKVADLLKGLESFWLLLETNHRRTLFWSCWRVLWVSTFGSRSCLNILQKVSSWIAANFPSMNCWQPCQHHTLFTAIAYDVSFPGCEVREVLEKSSVQCPVRLTASGSKASGAATRSKLGTFIEEAINIRPSHFEIHFSLLKMGSLCTSMFVGRIWACIMPRPVLRPVLVNI